MVAIVARAVVAKARPQDLPHILPGLGQVLAAASQCTDRGTVAPRQTAAMRELSRRAFPETDVAVENDAPTPFDATRSERRRQAEVSRAAALRRNTA